MLPCHAKSTVTKCTRSVPEVLYAYLVVAMGCSASSILMAGPSASETTTTGDSVTSILSTRSGGQFLIDACFPVLSDFSSPPDDPASSSSAFLFFLNKRPMLLKPLPMKRYTTTTGCPTTFAILANKASGNKRTAIAHGMHKKANTIEIAHCGPLMPPETIEKAWPPT